MRIVYGVRGDEDSQVRGDEECVGSEVMRIVYGVRGDEDCVWG